MGSDKALLAINDSFFLEILINKAGPFFREIILLSGPNSYQTGKRRLHDAVIEAGPLGGLLSALKDAEATGHSHLAMIPVDLPLFSETNFNYLSQHEPGQDIDVVIAKAGESVQPLAGIYNVRLTSVLEPYLDLNKRRVLGFISGTNHNFFWADQKELKNINSPDEYHEILSES